MPGSASAMKRRTSSSTMTSLGRSGRTVLDVPFADFLAPGLIVMAMMQNSFANSSFSLLVGKIQGTIIDYLMPPLSEGELMLAMTAAALAKLLPGQADIELIESEEIGIVVRVVLPGHPRNDHDAQKQQRHPERSVEQHGKRCDLDDQHHALCDTGFPTLCHQSLHRTSIQPNAATPQPAQGSAHALGECCLCCGLHGATSCSIHLSWRGLVIRCLRTFVTVGSI